MGAWGTIELFDSDNFCTAEPQFLLLGRLRFLRGTGLPGTDGDGRMVPTVDLGMAS